MFVVRVVLAGAAASAWAPTERVPRTAGVRAHAPWTPGPVVVEVMDGQRIIVGEVGVTCGADAGGIGVDDRPPARPEDRGAGTGIGAAAYLARPIRERVCRRVMSWGGAVGNRSHAVNYRRQFGCRL